MRVIKFRAKRVGSPGYWTEGGYCQWSDYKDNKKYQIISEGGYHNDVIPETVGQCTGRKDIAGKYIYEGDIITFDGVTLNGAKIVRIVKYSEENCRFEYGINGIWHNLYEAFMPTPRIIGNIHDNPKLLIKISKK